VRERVKGYIEKGHILDELSINEESGLELLLGTKKTRTS
jgi:hypothetical protein